MPKFVAVVGGKHSGKTTLIEHLVLNLKKRGYQVATIKEMPNTDSIDDPLPNHDTWKHSEAGADIVVAKPKNQTVFFFNRKMNLNEIANQLPEMDYVVLEGFEKEKTLPKIIAAKTAHEATEFSDGLAIALSGLIAESDEETKKGTVLQIPTFKSITQEKELADTVEQKAFTLLPNLSHCGECGFESCFELAKSKVADDLQNKSCALLFKKSVLLEVNGNIVPLKAFPQEIITQMLLGMVSSLNNIPKIEKLVLKIENKAPT
jgi:molybdopterin-guanine dinucleotide biosynthesis protein B